MEHGAGLEWVGGFAHTYTMLDNFVVSSKTAGCGVFLYNFIPISKARLFFP
jgi:hypothetical protein